jgi:Na+-driven multidrug efflux pump
VIAAGVDYLKVISWGYFANGIVFVCAGVFQGLGNTWPSLAASGLRAFAFTVPVLLLSTHTDLHMHTIWLLSVAATLCQLAVQQFFLRRELAIKAPR